MFSQRFLDFVWQYGGSVLLSFPRPDDQQIIGKIDVLDSETDTFHKAEAASIEQLSHEKIGAPKKGKEVMDLFASQDNWQCFIKYSNSARLFRWLSN
jgi:hypothetical protein